MPTASTFLDWFTPFSLSLPGNGLQFFGILIVGYIALLWLALIIWVTRDIMHRTSNAVFQLGAILLNIFLPVLGLVIYLILRPQRTLLEKYHEDLEYRLLEGGEDICFSCGAPGKETFAFCPNCGEALQRSCAHCKKNFSRRWEMCPWCGKSSQQSPDTKQQHAKVKT